MTKFDSERPRSEGGAFSLQPARDQPAIFFASMLAASLALVVAAALLFAGQALRDQLARVIGSVELSVFLSPQVARPEAEAMKSRIEAASVVSTAVLRTREDAMTALADEGLPALVNKSNPLPDVWIVRLRLPEPGQSRTSLTADVAAARSALAAIPGVESVRVDAQWVAWVEHGSSIALEAMDAARWFVIGGSALAVFCVFLLAGRGYASASSKDDSLKGPSSVQALALVTFSAFFLAVLLVGLVGYVGSVALVTPELKPMVDLAGQRASRLLILLAMASLFSALIGAISGSRRR